MARERDEVAVGMENRCSGVDGRNRHEAVRDTSQRLSRSPARPVETHRPLESLETGQWEQGEPEQRASQLFGPTPVTGSRQQLGDDDLRDTELLVVAQRLVEAAMDGASGRA